MSPHAGKQGCERDGENSGFNYRAVPDGTGELPFLPFLHAPVSGERKGVPEGRTNPSSRCLINISGRRRRGCDKRGARRWKVGVIVRHSSQAAFVVLAAPVQTLLGRAEESS